MARFFVRIEMHDPERKDYPELHQFMKDATFTRFTSSGRKYPDATYISGVYLPSATSQNILDIINRVLTGLEIKASVMVVKYDQENDLATSGLEAAESITE